MKNPNFSVFFFQNITVCLVFAQFSYINPFWNHKIIIFSYMPHNFPWKGAKLVKKRSKMKFWGHFFTNFDFLVNFDHFLPLFTYLVADMNRKSFLWFQNGFIFENWAKTKETVKFWKKSSESLFPPFLPRKTFFFKISPFV